MRIAPAAVDLPEVINSLAPERLLTSHPAKLGADRLMCGALSFLVEVNEGAVQRVTEKPARLTTTDAGCKRLDEYRS